MLTRNYKEPESRSLNEIPALLFNY
jgi:hypothetical protein